MRRMPVSLTLVLLFLLAVGLLFLHRADSSLFETWRTRVVDAVAPVLNVVSWPVKKVREGLSELDDYWTVYKENERLKDEIKQLKAWQAAARHYERQIYNYEKLLRVQPQPNIEYITARLIADGGSPFKHTFILNAGARQGIENGQGVVDGLDLIGRVVNVGERSSRVLRVTDINSRVPVMVEPSRKRAILAGDNSDRPKLEFVESKLEIQPGDRVVTSGDGGLLPPGLPVGMVVSAEKGKFRVQPQAAETGYEIVRVVRFRFVKDVKTKGLEPDTDESGTPAEGAADSGTVTAEGEAAGAAAGHDGPAAAGRGEPPAAGHAPAADPAAAPARAAERQPGTPAAAGAATDTRDAARETIAAEAEPQAQPDASDSERAAPAGGQGTPAAPAARPIPVRVEAGAVAGDTAAPGDAATSGDDGDADEAAADDTTAASDDAASGGD